MNLEEALRSLFLRHLRARRLDAVAAGDEPRATAIAALADALQIERDRASGEYRVSANGSEWRVPASDFVFYMRGDRATENAVVSTADGQFDSNRANADRWLDTFSRSSDA